MPDIVTQYHVVAQGAGFAEKSHRGRLRLDGADAVSFLQALVTADVGTLAAGESRYSAYLTPNGRMLADLRIHHRGDHLVVDVPAAGAAALAARFDSLIFTEDVRVSDVSASIAQFSVIGAKAGPIARDAADHVRRADGNAVLEPTDAFAAPTDEAAVGSVDLFVPAARRDALIAALVEAGATPMPADLVETFRIEAGRPKFGVDMTEETIPLEAGLLDRAISTTKGCYVGQEIIIRVLHRGGGRVARRLAKLAVPAGVSTPPAAGTALSVDGREVGAVTSAAFSPGSDRVMALGYVARDFAEVGRRVSIALPDGPVAAEIVALAG
jgi:folate-binding protein YgfZ